MKAEIKKDGSLWLTPETKTESYALEKWKQENSEGYFPTIIIEELKEILNA